MSESGPRCRLLELPHEIRQMIYQYYVRSSPSPILFYIDSRRNFDEAVDFAIQVSFAQDPLVLGVTCRQCAIDTYGLVLSRCTFLLQDRTTQYEVVEKSQQMRRVRYVSTTFLPTPAMLANWPRLERFDLDICAWGSELWSFIDADAARLASDEALYNTALIGRAVPLQFQDLMQRLLQERPKVRFILAVNTYLMGKVSTTSSNAKQVTITLDFAAKKLIYRSAFDAQLDELFVADDEGEERTMWADDDRERAALLSNPWQTDTDEEGEGAR